MTREQLHEWEQGCAPPPCPGDFDAHWEDQVPRSAVAYTEAAADLGNPHADYRILCFPAADGTPLTARYIAPPGTGPVPTVLTFHDDIRPVRGWFRLTRYAALGWAVLAPQLREEASAELRMGDALRAAQLALCLPRTNRHLLFACGDGYGGSMAIAAATRLKSCAVSVYNPRPGEGYASAAAFAARLDGHLLLATGFLSARAHPAGQFALFHGAACEKQHRYFPKHGEELNNFYENEQLCFFLERSMRP